MNQENRAKIQNAPIPTATTELRSFLELGRNSLRFINNFAETFSMLYSATSGNKKLKWNKKN